MTSPDANQPHAEITHRDDMSPLDALTECHDMWASGAWDDRNAVYNLEEVMAHVRRLLPDDEDDRQREAVAGHLPTDLPDEPTHDGCIITDRATSHTAGCPSRFPYGSAWDSDTWGWQGTPDDPETGDEDDEPVRVSGEHEAGCTRTGVYGHPGECVR